MKYERLTKAQRRAWEPVLDECIEKCRLYAQHVTHRDGPLFLYRPDAITEASRGLARIMGWDEGGVCMPDHLRRIAWDVQDHVHRRVTDRFRVQLPDGRSVKTSGSLPIDIAYTADGSPLGWCIASPREPGQAGTIIIKRGSLIVGHGWERLGPRMRLSRERPTRFEGYVYGAVSKTPIYNGPIEVRRPFVIASFAALEPDELGLDVERREREIDGTQEAALVRIAIADAVRERQAAIPAGEMATLYAAAKAAGGDSQEDVRHIVYQLFGAAEAA